MTKRLAAGLVLIALTAALTACGARDMVDPVAAAAVKSGQAGGMSMSLSVSYSVGGVASGTMTGSGVFDQDSGEMTIDASDLLGATGLPAGDGGVLKEIYVRENGDPVLYMSVPFLARLLPSGKTWMRLDLQEAGKALGVDFNQLLGQSTQNPLDSLDMLRASGSIEKVGPDVVDGAQVTRYHGVVDLKKALELKGVSAETVQRLLDAGAPTQLPVDVWIGDDDGLVHELRQTQASTVAGRSVSTTTTLKMSDWGTSVLAKAPPADQVFDASSLAPAATKA